MALALLTAWTHAESACAADWPAWRCDASRSGVSPKALPDKLTLHWSRDFLPPIPAWPDQEKMPFDMAAEPIVFGQTLFVNSSRHDCVRALDVKTGNERWTFFADGPIRFAPLAWEGKLYVVSDDGCLYCLEADTGKLHWKFRGGPVNRRSLGNERMISMWPARGAPVIADDTLYFAASIWPFMGTFIHALDARTGAPVWTNDGDGCVYIKQPHMTDSFAGIAPQGPLVVQGDKLILPGGRSVPAVFDRKTGKLLKYQLAEHGKRGGGSEVAAMGKLFFNGGAVFETASQKFIGDCGKPIVLADDFVAMYSGNSLRVVDPSASEKMMDPVPKAENAPKAEKDPKSGDKSVVEKVVDAVKGNKKWSAAELASATIPKALSLIRAGNRLYVGGEDYVAAFDFDAENKTLVQAWKLAINGHADSLIAAEDRLFVSTREGKLLCFGMERDDEPTIEVRRPISLPEANDSWSEKAGDILEAAKQTEGWALVLQGGTGRLAEELMRRTRLRIVVREADPAKIHALRTRWTAMDLYGTRVSILPSDGIESLPPYFASLIVSEGGRWSTLASDKVAKAYDCLRPHGGVAVMPGDAADMARVGQAKLANAQLEAKGEFVFVRRVGALPGSGNWTHEHADAANSRVSKDRLVKAPMGLLWFGGPTNDGILPRHGHGPQPHAIDGRIIIEGVDLIRALDMYTGRQLWETSLPGVGSFYNNLSHQPGANASGSNFVSMSDGIYVAYRDRCVVLDPADGRILREFPVPKLPDVNPLAPWGYIDVQGDLLLGGAEPLFDPKSLPPKEQGNGNDDEPGTVKSKSLDKLLKAIKGTNDNLSASRHLFALDRHTGKLVWSTKANLGFRHNGICIGGGRVFAIDRLSGDQVKRLKAKREEPVHLPRLVALDLATGRELWSDTENIFGTWLSWSDKHDILIEAGRVARDSLLDEPKGMRAYSAKDGTVLWHQPTYLGPSMILGDEVLQGQSACDIRTGKQKMRADPITGMPTPWKWERNYGCNTPSASENLMLFRSGAAGFFDLCNDGGTGNFGGFRSSCTNNLVVAGGILVVPEYTRTCTCSYQNQTSVALIHMPENEMWTSFGTKELKGPVRRVGLNFGGSGDRRAENGTLWLEYPSTGGISPLVQVKMNPSTPELYRRHASFVEGPLAWVASSGAKGLSEATLTLGKKNKSASYTVRLVFAEPENLEPGQRVFDVEIQGQKVLKGFDIVREAGGSRRSVVKEFFGFVAEDSLTVRLLPATGSTRPTILSGMEVIAEEK